MATAKVCGVAGCGKAVYCRGWCEPHYQRWKKHGDPLGGKFYAKPGGICAVEGCCKGAERAGMCRSHHHRKVRYGDPRGGSTSLGAPCDFLEAAIGSETDECIPWPFGTRGGGYGSVYIDGRSRLVHRVVCERVHGDAPTQEHEAAHSCNNRPCINPRHLRWATPTENAADKIAHGTLMVGEANPMHKLSIGEVQAIREQGGPLRVAADEFGVSITTVHRIRRRESWTWLE